MNEFLTLLSEYVRPLEIPAQWCPIAALVILWFEVKYLMYQSPRREALEAQQPQEIWRQWYYGSKLRESLLTVLAIFLAWSLLFVLARGC